MSWISRCFGGAAKTAEEAVERPPAPLPLAPAPTGPGSLTDFISKSHDPREAPGMRKIRIVSDKPISAETVDAALRETGLPKSSPYPDAPSIRQQTELPGDDEHQARRNHFPSSITYVGNAHTLSKSAVAYLKSAHAEFAGSGPADSAITLRFRDGTRGAVEPFVRRLSALHDGKVVLLTNKGDYNRYSGVVRPSGEVVDRGTAVDAERKQEALDAAKLHRRLLNEASRPRRPATPPS